MIEDEDIADKGNIGFELAIQSKDYETVRFGNLSNQSARGAR